MKNAKQKRVVDLIREAIASADASRDKHENYPLAYGVLKGALWGVIHCIEAENINFRINETVSENDI